MPSSEKVRQLLEAAAAPTPLAGLPPDQLVSLAARASTNAAASARLELYPRGMSAERALQLSLGVLTPPGLTPQAVRQRVAARYPEAEPLVDRPELDALMAVRDLTYDDQQGEYLLPGLAHLSTEGTLKAPSRWSSALPDQKRWQSPEALEAQAFQDALDRGVERGRFRVVKVEAAWADRAATLLARELGTEPLSLDHRLWSAMQNKATELKVEMANIIRADRAGEDGAEWHLLTKLAAQAAEEELATLLEDRSQSRLLVHPGILARYDLSRELGEFARRSQHEEGAAVLLLVPSHADGLAPNINNRLAVPTESEGQQLEMTRSWLENKHRAAAGITDAG